MKTINYDKYSTMSINQLISALNNAEKKQAKIKEKLKQEFYRISMKISSLIKSSLNKPRYYTIEKEQAKNPTETALESSKRAKAQQELPKAKKRKKQPLKAKSRATKAKLALKTQNELQEPSNKG